MQAATILVVDDDTVARDLLADALASWRRGLREAEISRQDLSDPGNLVPFAGMMRALDTDENGQISKAEAEAGAANLVARMDTNKDGLVSIDDFPG